MIVLLFSQSRLLSVHQRLRKPIRTSYVKKNAFFHFSVKDLVNFSKRSNDTGPGPVDLRAIFPVKKFYATPAISVA